MMGRSPYQKRFAEASEDDQNKVVEAMKLTDCYGLREKEVSLLSGGEAQRVITARAIAQDTDWLILDEPTSSLDVKHQIELMEALLKLKEHKSKTIIAVLHDINIASRYCNKIIMMKNGKIYCYGNTEDILTIENLFKVYGIHFEQLETSGTRKKYFIPSGT
jgi:iron complex transport system ATP-binding protein